LQLGECLAVPGLQRGSIVGCRQFATEAGSPLRRLIDLRFRRLRLKRQYLDSGLLALRLHDDDDSFLFEVAHVADTDAASRKTAERHTIVAVEAAGTA